LSTPPVSVIVLTHNTRDLVLRSLEAFYDRALSWGWQIIVVDNGSTDDTARLVSERFPEVELIRSERNLGFAGGNNLGLRRAQGRVVVLMNGDVLASGEALRAAADALMAQSDVGALSPRLVTLNGMPQPFAFGKDPTLGYLLQRGLRAILGLGPMHHWGVEHPIEVDWVSGACMLVRREVIEQVGLLDERFFLYFEDNDWCLRMRKAGWRVIYDPRFAVIHVGGASLPERYLASQVYYQSLVRFYSKHYGIIATMLIKVFLAVYRALRSLQYARKPGSTPEGSDRNPRASG